MHEVSLSETVLAVLRRHPGPHHGIRVWIADPATPLDELAETLRMHLATAQPPVAAGTVQVVALPRQRMCSRCASEWTSGQATPTCPRCDGPALPLQHDHTTEVELLD